MPANLNRKQQREIKAVVERAKKDNGIPQTAQQSIPFQRMFPDGICRVTDSYYTKTIQFQDINYQLAQQEDKTAMPEQIQSPSMTADWEEKLLLIEKGEYASEDFMDEIKDVIAGLIQNYEVIRDSEVLMSKEANSIGKCPLCGSAVEDKSKGYFCSNRGCSFALWKNNRYFASIGKSMTSATAQKLLGSGNS